MVVVIVVLFVVVMVAAFVVAILVAVVAVLLLLNRYWPRALSMTPTPRTQAWGTSEQQYEAVQPFGPRPRDRWAHPARAC